MTGQLATREAAAGAAGPDWDYLRGHGVDGMNILRFPAGAAWHTLRRCAHPACDRPSASSPWLCQRCLLAWSEAGKPVDVDGWCAATPAPPERRHYGERPCVVGCARPAEASGLCKSCSSEARQRGLTLDVYLKTRPAPRPGFGQCRVPVCDRMVQTRQTRLCRSHQGQWWRAGQPDLTAWAATAEPIYTAIDEVPLAGLPQLVAMQVLIGYEDQLRKGGRLNPSQVKSAIIWLRANATGDLATARLPSSGNTTTYLRLWQQTLHRAEESPEGMRRSNRIRLAVLRPDLRGVVHLADVQAPWLLHLAQEQIWALTASGAGSSTVQNVGHAARWLALFLRTERTDEGRVARTIGRDGIMLFLPWLADRARDSLEYVRLAPANPRRAMIAARLLPSAVDTGRTLLVSEQRQVQILRILKEMLDRHRPWLTDQGAGDLVIAGEEVPAWPERDRGLAEEEGRSVDALPETVFLQLMREENLVLLPEGSRRNLLELLARTGRRPWELRNLRFDCLDWDTVAIDRAGGGHEQRTYPFLIYWMQKTRKRHVLPLHETDAAVIARQQAYLRRERPDWFDAAGNPHDPQMLLFPTTRRSRRNVAGTHAYDSSTLGYWLTQWLAAIPELVDEDGTPFPRQRVFAYAFRHTYAQLRADAEVPLDVLQALMGHELPSTTQCYYRTSRRRRVDAVREIAARFRFDVNGDRIRAQTVAESDQARQRLGVGTVPVPAGSCHEMNNVRADGHGCPVFYRCFSCRFFTTDFTHLPALRDVRTAKAEQLERLQAGYGTILRCGPLADANLRLLTEEIAQLDQLIAKCETDLVALTDDERQRVQQWLNQRQRYAAVIPIEALTARRQMLDQPTVDPIVVGETPGRHR